MRLETNWLGPDAAMRNSQVNPGLSKKRMDRVRIRNSQVNQMRIRQEMNGPGPDTQFTNEPDPHTAINEWTVQNAANNRLTGTGSGYRNFGWTRYQLFLHFYYLSLNGDDILYSHTRILSSAYREFLYFKNKRTFTTLLPLFKKLHGFMMKCSCDEIEPRGINHQYARVLL